MYIININSAENQLSAGPEAVSSITDRRRKNAQLLSIEVTNSMVFIVDSFKPISVRG